ncbi:MAG: epoxyqueuosine reductase QueH [Candidatus Omnitrophica bacterium]|nr:epoxyqueuosine reductase QueH [Candidatus Omnitrophota bacterium]
MNAILLHICCGVCAGLVVQRLREEGFTPLGFFYNPNIHPEEEYQRRLRAVDQMAHNLGFELIKGAYDCDNWLQLTEGLENEPEGGHRCAACFKMRLEQAYNKAKELNIAKFTTTLTVSPHKNTAVINSIGKAVGPSEFLACDFKKKDGFRLAIEIAQRYNLYRQNYCGCVYSLNADKRRSHTDGRR